MRHPLTSKTLSPSYRRALFFGRVILAVLFIAGSVSFLAFVLFPSQEFFFNFNNSKAQNNSLIHPRSLSGESRANGKLEKGESLIANASAFGDFSKIDVSIIGGSDERELSTGSVSVRRSQQAFFLPEGPPAPFPKGSLLRLENEFFLVAPNGTLKRFPSEVAAQEMGYDTNAFLAIAESDRSLQRDGGSVSGTRDTPPDGAFVKVDGAYFEWRNGKLIPFASPNAFLYRFPDAWALPKDANFLDGKSLSDEWRGFPSSAVLAWGEGAFLVDQTSPRAILGVDIFLSLGYSWDDIIPVSDEELSLEQKGKAVTFATPHPDDTVFIDTATDSFFLVDEGKKRKITSDAARTLWLGSRHPISVSSESLTRSASCALSGDVSLFSSYALSCSLPIETLKNLPGDTYELVFSFPEATDIARIDASFETAITRDTLFTRLSKLKNRVLSRYISAPTP